MNKRRKEKEKVCHFGRQECVAAISSLRRNAATPEQMKKENA